MEVKLWIVTFHLFFYLPRPRPSSLFVGFYFNLALLLFPWTFPLLLFLLPIILVFSSLNFSIGPRSTTLHIEPHSVQVYSAEAK